MYWLLLTVLKSQRKNGKVLRIFFSDQDKFVTCYLVDENKNLVQHAEYVLKETDSQGLLFLYALL